MKSKPIKITWDKSKSWEEMRREMEGIDADYTRTGASDISVITGSNKYKCPQRLFYHQTGYYNSFFITERTLAGHLAEPVVMRRWEGFIPEDEQQSLLNSKNGVRLRKMKQANFFLINPEYPTLFASIDYVPVGKQYSPFTGELYHPLTPNEIKNTSYHYWKLWEDGITQQYLEQLNVQMMLGGTEVAVFHVYLDGVNYKVREVEREHELCQYLDHVSREWADKVNAGKECVRGMKEAEALGETSMWEDFKATFDIITPEPIGMSGDSKDGDNVLLLKELYDDSNGLEKIGDDKDEWAMNQYLKCNKTITKINTYKDRLKAEILLSLEDFEVLKAGERKAVFRRGPNRRDYFSIK